ncbi:MAG: metal-dependent hydrolase [Kamptonema sp. SIO1D9]|nr:metal-dependent hydrolase [Kamptonema sp. SIO1D9]
MMALTHAAIAAAANGFILSSTDPLIMGLTILGSQLPDLDTSTSIIGQICFPISSFIEDRYPHRSVTHSLLACSFLFGCSFGAIFLVEIPVKIAIALPLGHLISIFSDTFTKQGVQLFFPLPVWCVCGSNPRRRLRTGSTAEYWVLAVAIAALAINFQIAGGGGLVQTASQQLGLKDGIIAVYNENAATTEVYANITGYKQSDRSPVEGKYLIIGTAGSEFIVTNQTGVFQTGIHIIATSIKTELGEAQTTTIATLTFDDEEAIAKLNSLKDQNPNSQIFLNGSVTADFPEDIPLELQPDQLNTLQVNGSTVTLSYCDIDKAIAALTDQWLIGTIEAKIVQ